MRSADCARSIVLVATAGCQRSWPLKSRSTFQTTPVGGPTDGLFTMCSTPYTPDHAVECIETTLKHAGSDGVDEFCLGAGPGVGFRGPLQASLFAVGDRRQAQR